MPQTVVRKHRSHRGRTRFSVQIVAFLVLVSGFAAFGVGAAVHIDPSATLTVSYTATPNPTDLGQVPVVFTSSVSAGTGINTYAWEFCNSGTAAIANPSFVMTKTPCVVYLNVTDSGANTGTTHQTITSNVPPSVSAFTTATPNANVGNTVTFTSTVGFTGTGADVKTWGFGDGIKTTGASPKTHVYHATAVYNAYFNVTDSIGGYGNASETVTIHADPAAVLTATYPTVQVGKSTAITISFTGGTGKQTWSLEKNGSNVNLSGVVSRVYTFTPTHVASYLFYLNSTDARSNASATTLAIGAVADLGSTLLASNLSITTAQQSNINFTIGDGVTPYTWTLTETGSSINLTAVVAGSYLFVPIAAGNYTFYLNVTDSDGVMVSTVVTIEVTPAPQLPPPVAPTFPLGVIVVLFVLGGGALAFQRVVKRKR